MTPPLMEENRMTPSMNCAVWRKSSHSGGNGGQCVEVAGSVPGVVAVRDSKNPDGPILMFSPAAWAAFVDDVKGGRFGV